MIKVDWKRLGNCPECNHGSLDIESEDRISCNYYIYCTNRFFKTKTATGSGRSTEERQLICDQAQQYWYDRELDEN